MLALCVAIGACKDSESPAAIKESALRNGQQLLEAGQFGRAAAAFQQAVSADPTDASARASLARALEKSQQFSPAAVEAMRAWDLKRGDYEVGVLAARLVLMQGRYDDSLSISASLLNSRPDDPNLLVLWGTASARMTNTVWGLIKLGPTGGRGEAYDRGCSSIRPKITAAQDAEAEHALRRAVTLAPEDIEVRIALLNYLWAARRAEETGDELRSLADKLPGHALLNETLGHYYLARDELLLGEKYLAAAAAAPDPFGQPARRALLEQYLRTDRFDEALVVLDRFDESADQGAALAAKRAQAYVGLGRHAEALPVLEAILTRYPMHAGAMALKSRALLDLGQTIDAVDVGRLAVRTDPTRFDAHLALARALEAAQDLDGAYREYGEALKQDPSALTLTLKLAELGLATDRPRPALVYARQAAGAFPADPRARLLMVDGLVRAGDYKAAEFWLAPLQRQSPLPPDVHLLRAAILAGRGDERGARAMLVAAQALEPVAVRALTALVTLDLDGKRVADARARVDAVLPSRPRDPDVLRLAGIVHLAEGDLASAESALRRAREQRPADTDAALLLAQTLADLRRPSEARDLLRQVLERRPSSLVAQTSLAGVLESLGQLDEAQAIYRSVLAEYPDAVRAAARLAVLLITLGRQPSIALHALGVARRTAPEDPAVNDALGWIELHLERVSEALQHLEIAARGEPGNASFQYHLGAAYLRAGRLEAARQALTRALTLDPALPDRARAEASLAAIGNGSRR